jgi:LmbE family N-acetylglucosaminyl deacetylase
MLRLMVVTAHPDDEAGAFGGTLRLYHERGLETSVVCLTPGQAATHRGGTKSDQELAAIRRQEFAESCKVLGVNRAVVLDYADGQLHRVDLYPVVCEVTRQIREFRPHVLVTFGPEGAITAHPDHSMVSVFSTLAYEWAGRTNRYPDHFNDHVRPHRVQKLYYGTANFVLPERQPISLPPITATIDVSKQLRFQVEAFHRHKTQTPLFPIFENSVRQRGPNEMFHLAASVNPGKIQIETDLFAGVTEN